MLPISSTTTFSSICSTAFWMSPAMTRSRNFSISLTSRSLIHHSSSRVDPLEPAETLFAVPEVARRALDRDRAVLTRSHRHPERVVEGESHRVAQLTGQLGDAGPAAESHVEVVRVTEWAGQYRPGEAVHVVQLLAVEDEAVGERLRPVVLHHMQPDE